jgi:dTDP-4-dehydrorhamnose reductase
MNVLVLGASGLLGRAMMQVLPESDVLTVHGTVRSPAMRAECAPATRGRLEILPDVMDAAAVEAQLLAVRADVVINCVAPSREALVARDALQVIPLCAVFPHQLARQCERAGARLIHISTDGVFSGRRGQYTEDDEPDARDLYGMAKLLGEVREGNAITIRTSMVGHEMRNGRGLLEWFLGQGGSCACFSRAVFSGVPAVVLAAIVRDVIIPHAGLRGVYHVAADPISKCDLLRLVASVYGRTTEITPDDSVVIDRSLNPQRFRAATGYVAPEWPVLIRTMHSYWLKERHSV